jgi:hypothetical protein
MLLGLAMEEVGLFYGLLVYFTDIWYSLWLFGIFYPVLVSITEKNLATLVENKTSLD